MKKFIFYKKKSSIINQTSSEKKAEGRSVRRQKAQNTFAEDNLKDIHVAYPDIFPNFSKAVRKIRAIKRIVIILGWTALCIPFQATFLKLPGIKKITFVCFYWGSLRKMLGVNLRTFGKVANPTDPKSPLNQQTPKGSSPRPVLYIANHTSWLDIPVMGGVAHGSFVAKEEVGTWPLISLLCKLGRVLFVSRQRHSTTKEQMAMQERLKKGGSLILFPEGTSSDGSHLFPFMSSFFVLAKPLNNKPVHYQIPIIQPISIVYDRLDLLPVNRLQRPVYSWYGDMELAPHLWDLCQWSDMRCSVIYHNPLDPKNFKSRKELAQTTWEIIAKGTASLRQSCPDDRIKETI